MDVQNDDMFENIGLGCALDLFSEVDEVVEMIHNLKNIYANSIPAEKAYERYLYILDQYIEQPHLIDPHLERILTLLIDIVRDIKNTMDLKHQAFKYLWVIIKVRGYKVVIRYLPHEVADFQPVLKLIEAQDPNDRDTWQTRFVLLVWMSIIIIIPFHMSRFDTFEQKASEEKSDKSVMSRVFEICKTYAVANDKSRDATAFLISKFLTRSDVKEVYLRKFLDWAQELSFGEKNSLFSRYGALACVANILKHGKRDDLLPYANDLIKWIINTKYKESNDRIVLKFSFKIIQRLGLVFLKPRVATWRYKRGNRSLAENLSSGDTQGNLLPKAEPEGDEMEVDEDIEVPEEVEEVIDELINGLRNADSVVRWSAAKGIGRVTSRLPQELADEVVGFVLQLFNPREGDGAWHGACLALAELGRRGLLLPSRLPEVVPMVLKALVYDEMRGYASVGAHIRDAACYVSWAFARAYESNVLAPFVPKLASALLVVSVFDREINCRRAASAAFQENVGRQGTFPYGIDILTAADFFTVGVRTNAYLIISVYIAQFEPYTQALIDHLVEKKVDHWDTAIRELTAKALCNLTPFAPEYMSTVVIPKLFESTRSIDLNARHGAVLSIGHILYALSKYSEENKAFDFEGMIGAETIDNVKHLVPRFREKQYFKGLGGELMKQACSDFIEKCSLAHLPFHNKDVIFEWFTLLDECLHHEVLNIRSSAVNTLPAFFNEYFQVDIELDTQPTVEAIIKNYTQKLRAETEIVRMGYALAIGALPFFMLKNHLEVVVSELIFCARVHDTSSKWSQSRRDAVKALTSICRTCGIDSLSPYINDIYDCFLNGLSEYTLDSRGDVGAWVREASLIGLQTLTIMLAKEQPLILNARLVCRIIQGSAQLATEKIDRTRTLAGRVFSNLIHSDPIVPNIPHHSELKLVFPADVCQTLNWNSESDTFPRFVRMLSLPTYTYNILLGLVVSVGGLSEGLVRHSSASFFSYLKDIETNKEAELIRICDIIIEIFTRYQHVDRVTTPMFSFLDRLLNSGCIRTVTDNPDSKFASQILDLLKTEIAQCKDIYKLIDSINVLCQLIQVPTDVCEKSLVRLSMFLCNPKRYIRKSTSGRLYEALLMYGDNNIIPADSLDEAMSLLSDTNWELGVDELRPIRNKLCEMLGIKPPIPKSK